VDKKVLVAGGSGFIGRMIVEKLLQKNYSVSVLTRNVKNTSVIFGDSVEAVNWNEREQIIRVLEKSASVINLSGANVMGKRWSATYKELIRSSRVDSTRLLLDCINEAGSRPESYISASAIGYYPRSEAEVFDEYSEPGDSFLAEVTKDWEDEAKKAAECGVREVRIRIGIVLHKSGGALQRMLLPFSMFAGGPLGSGRQWFCWIHAADVVNLYIKAIEDTNIHGAINAVSPNPVTMSEFAKTLGKVMNRPSLFKVPAFVLKVVLGEASVEVLTGTKIYPKRTIELGYNFEFEKLEEALQDLI
jgi:uncharacterized protein (TIGR01777 family)